MLKKLSVCAMLLALVLPVFPAASRAADAPAAKHYDTETAQQTSMNDVRAFVCSWFAMSDRLAAPEEYLPMLADDVVMSFPGVKINSKEDFISWRKSMSGDITLNMHRLGMIEVVRMNSAQWLAQTDIDWLATAADGKPVRQAIHQRWIVEERGGKLVLVRREATVAKAEPETDWNKNLPDLKYGTANDVRTMVYSWFAGFDRQKPEDYFTAYLPDDVRMHFPDFPVQGKSDFLRWYKGVRDTISWNTHELEYLDVTPAENGRWKVSLSVRWLARAYDGTIYDTTVHQNWLVGRSAQGAWQLLEHDASAI